MQQTSKTIIGARNLQLGAWNLPAGAWNLLAEMVHLRQLRPQVLHAPGAMMTVVKQTSSKHTVLHGETTSRWLIPRRQLLSTATAPLLVRINYRVTVQSYISVCSYQELYPV